MTEVNFELSTPQRKPVQLCNCDVVRQFENNILSAIEGGDELDVGVKRTYVTIKELAVQQISSLEDHTEKNTYQDISYSRCQISTTSAVVKPS